MMRRRSRALLLLNSIQDNLVQHDGHWLIVMKIRSVDIENKSDLEKEATMSIFQSLLRSLSSQVQIIFRKTPLDFSKQTIKLQSNILSFTHRKMREYGESYLEYLNETTKNKMDKVNYLIIKTDRRCGYEEGKSYLEGMLNTISTALSNLNIDVLRVVDAELKALFNLPSFIKEEVDYFVYGEEMKRTYVIMDYPRSAYPNWLKPITSYHHPIELTQHFHPIPRNKVIKQLELQLAKLQSTMDIQENNGDVVSSELKVRKDDVLDLLRRLASGEDTIMETSFYITLSAPNLEMLSYRSIELESYMRQCGLTYRTCRRQVNKGVQSILPVCNDHMLESYTFDTKSLSTLLPFTVQDYVDENGILYGLSSDLTEMICVDLWNLPNPNKIILGKTGFGKSMLAKTETARHIINGIQAIILDHNGEWKDFCDILGGEYIVDNKRSIRWNSHLLVFNSSDKVGDLQTIWKHIRESNVKQRVLVLEEFHNVLREDRSLLLQIAKEIRKSGTAPTFITQNARDCLMTEEGQMIFDNCSVKVFLRQGENDLQEIEKLFDLSRNEKVYLSSCPRGYGYLYTDLYKTRFKVDYSEREEEILSTNPMHKIRRTSL